MTAMNPNLAQLMQRIEYLRQTSAQARQLEQMILSKSPGQKRQLVENMCKERGIPVEDLARSLGLTLPVNR